MISFGYELQAVGYTEGTARFFCVVERLLTESFPGQTGEQLGRNPSEALLFCDKVRLAVGLVNLADELILAALENCNKPRKQLSVTG